MASIMDLPLCAAFSSHIQKPKKHRLSLQREFLSHISAAADTTTTGNSSRLTFKFLTEQLPELIPVPKYGFW